VNRRLSLRSTLAAALALPLLVAACSSGAPATASPSQPTPVLPSPSSAADGVVIHASWTQALPPRALFGNLPVLVVTADGRVLTQGPVREIYPGPLVAPFVERPISSSGVAALLEVAKDSGILGPDTDFTGRAMPMGAAAARLKIAVDGVTHDLVGDPNAAAPCPPNQPCPEAVPGTPAAFARFWYQLQDMAGWLGPELGPEQPHVPASYAVIVGPPPEPWAGATPVVWPAADPSMGAFGAPVRGEPGTRCGIAIGDLAVALDRTFAQATVLTPFVATASASSTRGLTVRALLPGDEDPCAPIVE
jgi:hypothetical protein